MTALECLAAAKAGGSDYQRAINLFLDEFRRANDRGRRMLVQDPRLRLMLESPALL